MVLSGKYWVHHFVHCQQSWANELESEYDGFLHKDGVDLNGMKKSLTLTVPEELKGMMTDATKKARALEATSLRGRSLLSHWLRGFSLLFIIGKIVIGSMTERLVLALPLHRSSAARTYVHSQISTRTGIHHTAAKNV
ncbi:hypothetical protein PM082_009644 [Marasmius tenuissimus]|nr:hypothetical protein PM082_009644 [Marasmius tenuissimus]